MSYVWNTFGILANHREIAVLFVAVAIGHRHSATAHRLYPSLASLGQWTAALDAAAAE